MPFPENSLPLIEKIASQLTAPEMRKAVVTAIDETKATDPEMSRKWRSVSQMCPQHHAQRPQAVSLVQTATRYEISLGALEAIIDSAIERKQDVGSHIADCVDRLVGICEESGLTVTDEMRDGFRTATAALAEQVNKARSPIPPEQPDRWTDRVQRQQEDGLPPFG